jgi:hypothetical protein
MYEIGILVQEVERHQKDKERDNVWLEYKCLSEVNLGDELGVMIDIEMELETSLREEQF